jgi:hypothetical protein
MPVFTRRAVLFACLLCFQPYVVVGETPQKRSSWLSCVEELSLPVVNDMDRGRMRGQRQYSIDLEMLLDKNARPGLAGSPEAYQKEGNPFLLVLGFLDNQKYRSDCAGQRFKLSIRIRLVDRHAGRMDSRIRDDNSIELVYHDNATGVPSY